jgi:hypothetical protein
MGIADEVGRVCRLPDDALLAGLSRALGSSRGWTALVLAHLAEVEERRLHLIAGHGSMFAYCTARLGMSEDEACRRIEVARLARRYPILYEKLASGEVSLSVAALLKHHLTGDNHAKLLAAVAGKTVAQAREVLAAWFPQPDVLASIRKLPERPRAATDAAHADEVAARRSETPWVGPIGGEPASAARSVTAAAAVQVTPAGAASGETRRSAWTVAAPTAGPVAPRSHAPAIQPLSPDRYKIVFTADAELKHKLELATDLLRHAVPSGDLATIVGRALDLLLEATLRRRFARTARTGKATAQPSQRHAPSSAAGDVAPERAGTRVDTSTDGVDAADGAHGSASLHEASETSAPSRSRHLPSAVRRAVLERDGLRCTWQGPDGRRCESRAFLEHDHIHPRGRGGSDEPANIHLRCRAHNQLSAEQTYGKSIIARIVTRHRNQRRARATPQAPRAHP